MAFELVARCTVPSVTGIPADEISMDWAIKCTSYLEALTDTITVALDKFYNSVADGDVGYGARVHAISGWTSNLVRDNSCTIKYYMPDVGLGTLEFLRQDTIPWDGAVASALPEECSVRLTSHAILAGGEADRTRRGGVVPGRGAHHRRSGLPGGGEGPGGEQPHHRPAVSGEGLPGRSDSGLHLVHLVPEGRGVPTRSGGVGGQRVRHDPLEGTRPDGPRGLDGHPVAVATRSAVIAHGSVALTANGNAGLGTVPSGEVWLVKNVVCYCTVAAAPAELRFGIDSGSVNAYLLRAAAMTVNDFMRSADGDWWVAEAGASLRLTNPGGALTVRYHVSGARLPA